MSFTENHFLSRQMFSRVILTVSSFAVVSASAAEIPSFFRSVYNSLPSFSVVRQVPNHVITEGGRLADEARNNIRAIRESETFQTASNAAATAVNSAVVRAQTLAKNIVESDRVKQLSATATEKAKAAAQAAITTAVRKMTSEQRLAFKNAIEAFEAEAEAEAEAAAAATAAAAVEPEVPIVNAVFAGETIVEEGEQSSGESPAENAVDEEAVEEAVEEAKVSELPEPAV